VKQEIADTFALAKAANAKGHAAQLWNEELDRLGAQRKQLERELRQQPPTPSLSLETDAVIARLNALLDDVGTALIGPERDAARARDIVRSFVKEVVVTPVEPEGRPDGRGAGPVRITVHGSLTELLGHAASDRVIQRRGSTLATLDLPTVAFEFWIDLNRDNSDVEGAYPDLAVFSRLLDDAYAPVATRALVEALNDRRPPTTDELPSLENRARRAIFRLKEAAQIRAVRLTGGEAGWVWNDRAISDAQWQGQARQPDPPKADPIVRMFAPEAAVVVVTPNRTVR
jgi:hypothetical protein